MAGGGLWCSTPHNHSRLRQHTLARALKDAHSMRAHTQHTHSTPCVGARPAVPRCRAPPPLPVQIHQRCHPSQPGHDHNAANAAAGRHHLAGGSSVEGPGGGNTPKRGGLIADNAGDTHLHPLRGLSTTMGTLLKGRGGRLLSSIALP